MARGYCPHCGRVTNLTVCISRVPDVGEDGELRQVETRTYHCEACHSFVRSEREESEPAAGTADEGRS